MRWILPAFFILCGALTLGGKPAAAAPFGPHVQAHSAATQVDYYWNHRHWRHRRWQHNHWHYYD